MINEKKYVIKGEKSAFVMPILLLIVVIGVVTYFSKIAAAVILGVLAISLLVRIFKINSFTRNLDILSKEENYEIHEIVKGLSELFNIKKPKIAIIESKLIEVFTVGIKEPYTLVVSDTALRHLTSQELNFAIAQELGNISRGKVAPLSMVSPNGTTTFVANLFFGSWQKKVESSSDRLGLLVNGDIEAAISVLIKAYYDDKDLKKLDIDTTIGAIMSLKRSQLDDLKEMLDLDSYTIDRIISLLRYSRSREYRNTAASTVKRVQTTNIKVQKYDEPEFAAKSYDDIYVNEEKSVEESIISSNDSPSDETRIFKSSEIQKIKDEYNISKENFKENAESYEEKEAVVEKVLVEKTEEKDEFENYTDEEEDDDFYNEIYQSGASGTKKIIVALGSILIIVVGGMLLFKLWISDVDNNANTNADANSGNNTNTGQEGNKEPVLSDDEKIDKLVEKVQLALNGEIQVSEISDTGDLHELFDVLEGSEGDLSQISVEEKKIIENEAYVKVKVKSGTIEKALILILNKNSEEWKVESCIVDKNPGVELGEVYTEEYGNSTFDSNVTYYREDGSVNGDINISQGVTGEEAKKIALVLEKFNDSWVEFINTGDKNNIMDYVKVGGDVHRIVDGTTTGKMKQTYLKHVIKDVRKGEKYYYVWLDEVIKEDVSGQVRDAKYNWIYTLEKIGEEYLIIEYVSDPNK